MIRDKLGENARVVSVRQIGGEGLKRFISSPKLEVIAEVPPPNPISEKSTEETPATEKKVDEVTERATSPNVGNLPSGNEERA